MTQPAIHSPAADSAALVSSPSWQALKSAATRAKLGADYRVAYLEREGSLFERLLTRIGVSAEHAINIQVKLGFLPDALPAAATADVARDMAWLAGMADPKKPFAAVTHCLCGEP